MKLIFRCDATADSGLGHLSRSLAIAEAVRRQGGEGVFVGRWSAAALTLLAGAGFSHRSAAHPTGAAADAAELAGAVKDAGAEGVLVDSYAIGVDWVERLAEGGVRVVLMDDFARLPDYAACAGVINFTVGATGLAYPGLPRGQFAAGPQFFPAREGLVRLRRASRSERMQPPRRILISLGGGDRLAATRPICAALQRLDPTVEIRALTPHGAQLAREFEGSGIEFPPTASDLTEHYAWADGCVSGGGLTKYECGYLGLPVAIFSQTPEQQAETDIFCRTGIGWDLAPSGGTSVWEARLAAFLRGEVPSRPANAAAQAMFPADSTDRAAAMLMGFLAQVSLLTPA